MKRNNRNNIFYPLVFILVIVGIITICKVISGYEAFSPLQDITIVNYEIDKWYIRDDSKVMLDDDDIVNFLLQDLEGPFYIINKYAMRTSYYSVIAIEARDIPGLYYYYEIGDSNNIIEKGLIEREVTLGRTSNIVSLFYGCGSNCAILKYYRVDSNNPEISQEYFIYTVYDSYITYDNISLIAYFEVDENGKTVLEVRDIFKSNGFSEIIKLDFLYASASEESLIFLNENEIYIKYKINDEKLVTEIINFRSNEILYYNEEFWE